MPVIDTSKAETSFTIVSEFDAPIERVWQLWADPRQLERWWGPPGYPAIFTRHDFAVPGRSVYYMRSEDGTPASADGSDATSYAGWRFVSIEAPSALEIDNGFSDETGEPIGDYPWNRFSVRLERIGAGTRMTVETRFGSPEELAQMLGLGMMEGSQAAQSQIDAILAEEGNRAMTFIESTKDLEALTLTIVAEFPATPERVWRLWEDPRQLERWWGPPGYPATFFRHDFAVPGRSIYYMTSPEGERHYGWWNYRSITAPNALEIEDGFGDEEGNALPDWPDPGLFTVAIEPVGDMTRMTITSIFTSVEQLEELMAMGQEEGMKQALGQIDAILAEG